MASNRLPEQVMLTRTSGGEFSTILHPDGTLETILFLKDGGTVGPVFTSPVISVVHDEHREILRERRANG